MEKALEELVNFVRIGARLDLKTVALENILDLTGSPDGVAAVYNYPPLLFALLTLLQDKSALIAKDVSLSLINITAQEKGAAAVLELDLSVECPPLQLPPENIVKQCLKEIFNKESKIADQCCMILSNVSRLRHLIEKVIDLIEESGHTFDELIEIFTKNEYNKSAKLHYLGPVLSNLTQSRRVRTFVLDKSKCVIQRLLPFTEYKDSMVRRGGVIGTLKNCCFETDYHEWLLSEDVDILSRLLLPLAGPEEFDEEDNDKLPLDLQYLPEDKTREGDPDIRCILIEAITQLCSTRVNREYIRDKNTYIILRELHKWEKDPKALLACENLVDILIRTEEEIGENNLKELEIPTHLIENFNQIAEEA
ncbi:protein HGH1 homolog [Dendroctonus ponderosae]|uniref:Protein HGH1 homolog n=1 Tax=Dendroctonus ponderosae TaxID=77166 RepID=A0AAR5Q8P1_DENPD|nr:protein HGH1 homolog [Dendroctonus ponderosae]XP_048521382.1 protein HGH1 homolog [Dendroctonus ponderosae]XP_048521807.1 protein HGH1 homolog [Dendroctonus ponderosae]